MLGTALYLPREPSIGNPGVNRPERFTTTLVRDHELMQTERKDYVPGWLWTPAAIAMLLACAAFITAMSIGIARATDVRPDGPDRPDRPDRPGDRRDPDPARTPQRAGRPLITAILTGRAS